MNYKETILEAKKLINAGVTGSRATYLCAAIAHSRGRMHFQRVGHWWAYNAEYAMQQCNEYPVPQGKEGLEWQSKTIRENLKHVERSLDWKAKRESEGGTYHSQICLSNEELSMVVFLLDAGDSRHLRGAGAESGVDLLGTQDAVGM